MLTPEEVNKRADEIVKNHLSILMHGNITDNEFWKHKNTVNDKSEVVGSFGYSMCVKHAILHVEEIVELLKGLTSSTIFIHAPSRKALWDLLDTNKQILQNLKERIK